MSIIKKPIITEKMTDKSEKYNRYAFVVDRKANKIEIKKAVVEMYDVAVDFGVSSILGCDSMLVEFEDLSNHPFGSVNWDFGDGEKTPTAEPHWRGRMYGNT